MMSVSAAVNTMGKPLNTYVHENIFIQHHMYKKNVHALRVFHSFDVIIITWLYSFVVQVQIVFWNSEKSSNVAMANVVQKASSVSDTKRSRET